MARMWTRAAIAAGAIGVAALAVAQPHGGKQQGGSQDMGAMLMNGLRNTPGCLGVDAGQMMSGKNAIFAWFENKAAVKRWYYSDVHMGVMKGTMEGGADMEHAPLEHVEDEDTPILVIASITFTDKPELEGIRMPISQISIELYGPLPGGAHVNGRLAPKAFEVAHMKDYSEGPPSAQPQSE